MERDKNSLYKPWRDWMAPAAALVAGVATAESARRRLGVANGLVKRIGFDVVGAALAVGAAETLFQTLGLGYKTEDWYWKNDRMRLIRQGIPPEELSHPGKTAIKLLGTLQDLSDAGMEEWPKAVEPANESAQTSSND
jgi:hypothetical protein